MAAAMTSSVQTQRTNYSAHCTMRSRLPEKQRLALVLCDMEGKTQTQAAHELDWSERTLRRRLAEARERLRARLARRGLVPQNAMSEVLLIQGARSAVPAAWSEATVRAAIATVNHPVTAGLVSAAAQQLAREVFKIMFFQKLKFASAALLAAGLIGWGASAALVSPAPKAPQAASTPPATAILPNGQHPCPAAESGLRRHDWHVRRSRPGARP